MGFEHVRMRLVSKLAISGVRASRYEIITLFLRPESKNLGPNYPRSQ